MVRYALLMPQLIVWAALLLALVNPALGVGDVGDVALEHILDDPVPQAGALFGFVIEGVGDVNGDSVPDVAMSSHAQDVGGNVDQGQVFVFSGADGALLYTLDDPNPQASAGFGGGFPAIANIGDVNGDSVADIVVGATRQTVGAVWRQGQAFVFSGADGALLYTLDDPNPQSDSHFGFSLAGMGDVDGNGVPDIAVSSHAQTVGGTTRQGQVYVVSGVDGSLLYTVDHPSPQAHSGFGKTMGAIGDVDADSVSDLAVGANQQTVGGSWRQGQAYVFSGVDGRLLYTLDDPIPQPLAGFGSAPTGVGDVDGDLVPDIAVGAASQDVSGNTDQGLGFVFSGADGSLLNALSDPSPTAHTLFGNCFAGLGDLDGDGTPDVAVCAPGKDIGGNTDQGRVFVFSGAGGSFLLTLDHPNPMGHAWFGQSIARLGEADRATLFAVGAHVQDVSGNVDQGQAYVFSFVSSLSLLIDIKPGSDISPINPSAQGLIPVAILGSEVVDVMLVDPSTLSFGPSGAAFGHTRGVHYEDVNGDGATDLLAHFRVQETGIAMGENEACLSGLLDGLPFTGCDSIRTVPSWVFSGTAVGGATIEFVVNEVALQITTFAGQTAADVAGAIADAINENGTLQSTGTRAEAMDGKVFTTGIATGTVINDAGISDAGIDQAAVPLLGTWQLVLLALVLLASSALFLHRRAC